MLQAPVLGYRRGRGVLDSRDPLSVTLPLGRELWGEADVVLGIGSRMLIQFRQWGMDKDIKVMRIDADAEEPGRLHKPAVGADRRRQADAARACSKCCPRTTPSAPRAGPRWRRARPPGESACRELGAADRLPRGHPRRAARGRHPGRRGHADRASPRGWRFRSTSRARFCRRAIRTISAGALPQRWVPRTPAATCRWSRSPATAASCSPPTRWPPRSATASR